jgi:L-aspartate oxidase
LTHLYASSIVTSFSSLKQGAFKTLKVALELILVYKLINMSDEKVVILGTGLAGLYTALRLSKAGLKSVVITKGKLAQTNTWRAQGGIAVAYSESDSTNDHLQDTIDAGDGLCLLANAKRIIDSAPETLNQFLSEGMLFDKEGSGFSLGKEGGHQKRRILHVSDQTGKAMHSLLIKQIKDQHADSISILENSMAYKAKKNDSGDFTIFLTNTDGTEHKKINCSHLVLATGGAGKAFLYTSNWEGATGDGFKIAHDLGCPLINAEFVQFHPTCLYHPKARRFLITEALRGEGAILVNHEGKRFMLDDYPQAELSPRDVVSLAIETEIKTSGKDCVFLDITHKEKAFLQERFPMIFDFCMKLGIDISKDLIPIVPAAHYFCGGVETNKTMVETRVDGLYAVGEVGYTGLHGANRLASNSLLECLVTADMCSKLIAKSHKNIKFELTDHPIKVPHPSPEELFATNSLWDEVRSLLWSKLGIKRSKRGLLQAKKRLNHIESEVLELSESMTTNPAFNELASIVFYAKACIASSLLREESRGSHYRVDFQNKSEVLYNTAYLNGKSLKVNLEAYD